MAEINLIKAVIEEKTKKRQERARLASVVVFIVLFIVVVTILIVGGRFMLAQQNKNLDSQIKTAEAEAKEAEEIEDNINLLNSDYSKIKAVEKTSRDWSEIFSKIAEATPTDIQLNKINYSGTAASTSATKKVTQEDKLQISGFARSRRAVSLFQEKLQQNTDIFSSVEIIKVGTVAQNEISIINFEIEAILKKI